MKARRLALGFVVFTTALAAQTPPAAAPPPPQEADLRCLAAMSTMASSDEDEVREAALYGTIFFIGKLLGRNPDLDIAARMSSFDFTLVMPEDQRNCLIEVQTTAQSVHPNNWP